MPNQSAAVKPMSGFDRGRIFGLNTLGFLVVTLTAYFSTVITTSYGRNRIGSAKAAALIGLAVAYLLNGLYGYAWARIDRI